MPPRRGKKTAGAKRRVSTPAASSADVEAAPHPSTVEESTAPEADSILENDQTGTFDLIMTAQSQSAIKLNSTEEGASSQSDPVIRARPAKKRAVVKVAASVVKKEAVASVKRDQIEQKIGSLSEKEIETEKLEASKDGIDGRAEEPLEEVLEMNAGEEKEMDREEEVQTVKEKSETGGKKEHRADWWKKRNRRRTRQGGSTR
jgi:hypothetical protein